MSACKGKMTKDELRQHIQEHCWCEGMHCYMVLHALPDKDRGGLISPMPLTFYYPVLKDGLEDYLNEQYGDS